MYKRHNHNEVHLTLNAYERQRRHAVPAGHNNPADENGPPWVQSFCRCRWAKRVNNCPRGEILLESGRNFEGAMAPIISLAPALSVCVSPPVLVRGVQRYWPRAPATSRGGIDVLRSMLIAASLRTTTYSFISCSFYFRSLYSFDFQNLRCTSIDLSIFVRHSHNLKLQ